MDYFSEQVGRRGYDPSLQMLRSICNVKWTVSCIVHQFWTRSCMRQEFIPFNRFNFIHVYL